MLVQVRIFCLKYVVHTKLIKIIVKDLVILVVTNCGRRLNDISLITSVYYERQGIFELIITSYSLIFFDS